MDPKQAEIGGKDYLVFLYVYYNPLYPFALRPSHQGLVQGWNLEVLLAARTEGRWKCRQSYADSMCGHSTRSRALSLSLMQSIPGGDEFCIWATMLRPKF